MDLATLLTFALAFFVFAASPGPDNMTIIARTLSHGALSGIAYGLGTVTGILFFLALAAFGLSVLAQEMGVVMTVLRYGGAIWLIWTGIRLWTAPVEPVAERKPAMRAGFLSAYVTGIALNLGNPKMPLFYIALLPNIASSAIGLEGAFELALVIILVETIVIGGHVWIALRSQNLLTSPRIRRRVNRLSGTVMIGTGAVALAAR